MQIYHYQTLWPTSNLVIRTILCVFRDITTAINHASALKIYHRDIKPANLIIHDGHGYLIDWGVATSGGTGYENEFSATLAFASLNVLEIIRAGRVITPYSVRDELESIFYTLIHILCGGDICWVKTGSVTRLLDSRHSVMTIHFHEQCLKAPEECRSILFELHGLLFGRKAEVEISEIVNFSAEKSWASYSELEW